MQTDENSSSTISQRSNGCCTNQLHVRWFGNDQEHPAAIPWTTSKLVRSDDSRKRYIEYSVWSWRPSAKKEGNGARAAYVAFFITDWYRNLLIETRRIAQHSAKNYHILDGIRDIRLKEGVHELKVKRLGFEDMENTWEPLKKLKETVAGQWKISYTPPENGIWSVQCYLFIIYEKFKNASMFKNPWGIVTQKNVYTPMVYVYGNQSWINPEKGVWKLPRLCHTKHLKIQRGL